MVAVGVTATTNKQTNKQQIKKLAAAALSGGWCKEQAPCV
jgi:hypothetical protein